MDPEIQDDRDDSCRDGDMLRRILDCVRNVDWLTLIFCVIAPIYPIAWTVAYDIAFAVYVTYGHWPDLGNPDPKSIHPEVLEKWSHLNLIQILLCVLMASVLYKFVSRFSSAKRKVLSFALIPVGFGVAYLLVKLDIGGVYKWIFD